LRAWKAISSAVSRKVNVDVCTMGVVKLSNVFGRPARSPARERKR
jgi:hypothetical protein